MKRIIFVYPLLTSYILPVFQEIADSGRIKMEVIYSPAAEGEGFGRHLSFGHPNVKWLQVPDVHPFGEKFGMLQLGIVWYFIKSKPDMVLIWSNPRYLSFWGILITGRLMGIPVFPRGHGLFKKKRVGIIYKVMYKLILALSQKYICYTPQVLHSLKILNCEEKLAVDYNTLDNSFPILPEIKTGNENGIFYIGRVRPGCGVETLIEAVKILNDDEKFNIQLHVIGDGRLGSILTEKEAQISWLNYYGKLYDQRIVSDISRHCRFGCGPGFMGLNVVHMMSLSLPVVTHKQLDQHMGPEPEYVMHKVNGWLMESPNNLSTLVKTLRILWMMPISDIRIMQKNAYDTYTKLCSPPYFERLLSILGG